jgi:fumarate reductase subunit C
MMELGKKIKGSKRLWNQDKNLETSLARHFETSLWIWQIRTGMIVLATGAFHLILVAWNIFTDMGVVGQEPGLSVEIAMSRVESGLWILYVVLMFTVVAHMAIGVYRLLVKWFADTWFVRRYSRIIFYFLFGFFTLLGIATTIGLAGPWEGLLS